jgi:hypothetical protein
MLAPKGRAGRLATGFVALTLPMFPPIAPSLISKKSAATPLENVRNSSSSPSLAVLFPISIGFLDDGELLVCLGTVIVIEGKA